MIEIVCLKTRMQYFDKFIEALYSEYGDKLKTRNKKDIIKFYKLMVNNIYIALHKNKFVGCYMIKMCFISDVYVAPKYRNKGIGRLLIKDAKNRSNLCLSYQLYSNKKSIGFYQKLGFHVFDKRNPNKMLMVSYNINMILLIFSLIICLLVYFLF